MPEEENYVFKSECRIKLNEVEYLTFQGAIKRFGYRINLNDEHIKSISKEIKLDVYQMNDVKNSAFHIVYKDSNKFFVQSRHTVNNLLKLGFLLCKHNSVEDQEKELWHLINPQLQKSVTKAVVQELLEDLAYIAIEMNNSKIF